MSDILQFETETNAADAAAKPLTVLQIVPALTLGGTERTTQEVAAALLARGGRALIAAPQTAAALRLRASGATLVEMDFDTRSPFRHRSNVKALVEIIREHGVDVIHARSREGAAVGQRAADETGIGFVTTWDEIYEGDGILTRPLTRAMASGRPVIAASDFMATHLQRVHGVNPDRIVTIPRGADMEVFAEEVVSAGRSIQLAEAMGLAEDPRPVILSPGSMVPGKGRRVLIEAAALLKDLRGADDFTCVIIGEGDDGHREDLEDAIRKAGVGDVVRIGGSVSDMPAALKLSSIVAVPSTRPETSARIVIEAQAMGRPVVVSDHGAAPDVMQAGGSGWLVPPGDAAALAGALSEALDMDASARAHIGMAGRALVRSRFTLEAMLNATMAVYEQAASEGEGPRFANLR